MFHDAHPSRSHSRWRHHTSCLARYTEPTRHRTASNLLTWFFWKPDTPNFETFHCLNARVFICCTKNVANSIEAALRTTVAAFDCHALFKGFIRTVSTLRDAVTQSVARHTPTVRTSVAVVTALVRRAKSRAWSWNLSETFVCCWIYKKITHTIMSLICLQAWFMRNQTISSKYTAVTLRKITNLWWRRDLLWCRDGLWWRRRALLWFRPSSMQWWLVLRRVWVKEN